MNKKTLIEKFSENNNLTKKDAQDLFENVISIIVESLEENKEFTIPQFGKFTIKHFDERQGRNPRTGEALTISAKNKVKFAPSKTLEEKFN